MEREGLRFGGTRELTPGTGVSDAHHGNRSFVLFDVCREGRPRPLTESGPQPLSLCPYAALSRLSGVLKQKAS